jgi:uncharacterized membrane protein YvlD (DUF360 family)
MRVQEGGAVPLTKRRVRGGDIGRLAVSWITGTLSLMVAAGLLDGLSATTPLAYAAVALVVGVAGLVIRPVLVEVSARVGWLAVLPVAVAGQALILYGATLVVPGIHTTFGPAFAACWLTAGVSTLIEWATVAGTDDALVTALARRSRRRDAVSDPEVDGVLFVQLDGVPFPVLRWAIESGLMPTMRRWLSSQTHVLREWTAQLPCTTPASQLGILHGTVDGVPAFRWYDRELGRVLVANRPADARVIEQGATDGRGLLADDGVSISNLFSGDAERALLTMSRIEPGRGSTQTRRAFAWFLATPGGFARSLSRAFGELFRERWQAHRQVARDFEPRVPRGWTFAMLRAVSNGILRDLNTALVAEEMNRGTRSIFVDYVDYDEVAHHAGLSRAESLAVLDRLDAVLGSLEQLSRRGARPYRIVVLSDHGQSQGLPFAARFGEDLAAVCTRLMAERVVAREAPPEAWGGAEAVTGDVAGERGVGRLAARLHRRVHRRIDAADDGSESAVVLGSGNLGLLYAKQSRRSTLNDLDERWPALVQGLASHPGVGFVAGVDRHGVAWAVGGEGRRNLDTGEVRGCDPLAELGAHAARVLRRAVLMPKAPDLYVNSAVGSGTWDVPAFEPLVGSHGGLGGWQDSAVLVVPAELADDLPARIEGADALHTVLVEMLRAVGHRGGLPAETVA